MKRSTALPIAAAVLLLAACGDDPTGVGGSTVSDGEVAEPPTVPVSVTAELVDPEGSRLGDATLTDEANGVLVEVDASGMTPGDHPVGLYQVGACDPEGGFASAGDLVLPVEDLGDLPSLVVGDETVGRMSSLVDDVDLEELLEGDGTALVVHPVLDTAVPPEEARATRVACAEFTG